jgi:hypothetical protein
LIGTIKIAASKDSKLRHFYDVDKQLSGEDIR